MEYVHRKGTPHPGRIAIVMLGSTNRAYAKASGYQVTYVSKVFSGDLRPGPRFMEALAEFTGQPASVLFPLDYQPKEKVEAVAAST